MTKGKRKAGSSRAIDTHKHVGWTSAFVGAHWGETVAWIALLAAVALVPLATTDFSGLGMAGATPLTLDQYDLPKVAILTVLTFTGIAGWLISLVMNGGSIRFRRVDLLVSALFAWILVSTAFSAHPPTSLLGFYGRFEGALSLVDYMLLYLLAVQLINGPTRMQALLRVFTAAGLVISLFGLAQHVGLGGTTFTSQNFGEGRSYATFGNPNLLAGYLVMVLPVALGLALSQRKGVWAFISWLTVIASLSAIVTAFTRSAWLAVPFAVLPLIVSGFRQSVRPRPIEWGAAAVAVGAAVGFVIRSTQQVSPITNASTRVSTTFELAQGSSTLARLQIWEAALGAIRERPVFGFGPDTFRLAFTRHKPLEYVQINGYLSVADNAHNYPLQMATTLGVPGVALLYGVFGWVLAASARTAFARSSVERLAFTGAWAACLAYLVHASAGITSPGTSSMLWILLGLLVAATPAWRSVRVEPLQYGGVLALGIGLVAVAPIALAWSMVSADGAYVIAKTPGVLDESRIDAAARAAARNPLNFMYRREVALAYETAAGSALAMRATDPSATQNALSLLNAADQQWTSLIAFIPAEYENYVLAANTKLNLAEFTGQATAIEQAIALSEAGMKLDPNGPAIRWTLARALLLQGKTTEAREQAERALEMDPKYAEAAVLVARILSESGDTLGARRVLTEFESRFPGDPGVVQALQGLDGGN